jgi:hypothetical protein
MPVVVLCGGGGGGAGKPSKPLLAAPDIGNAGHGLLRGPAGMCAEGVSHACLLLHAHQVRPPGGHTYNHPPFVCLDRLLCGS